MSASIVVKLPSKKQRAGLAERHSGVYLVTPGDIITEDSDYMRGHGKRYSITYIN